MTACPFPAGRVRVVRMAEAGLPSVALSGGALALLQLSDPATWLAHALALAARVQAARSTAESGPARLDLPGGAALVVIIVDGRAGADLVVGVTGPEVALHGGPEALELEVLDAVELGGMLQ